MDLPDPISVMAAAKPERPAFREICAKIAVPGVALGT
jgi:hypothetical protein